MIRLELGSPADSRWNFKGPTLRRRATPASKRMEKMLCVRCRFDWALNNPLFPSSQLPVAAD